MRRISLAMTITALACATLPSVAFAHAKLEAATPPIGGTVKDAPALLDLKFNEELNLKFTGVKVTGPDKKAIKTDDAMLMDGDKEFMVSLPAGLGSGTYRVEWHALSRDGHKVRGEYQFTVKP